jgi:hypothetical protein
MNTFFISVTQVKERSYLDANVDERTIKLAILDAQEQIIQPVLGSSLYRRLVRGINDLTMPTEYQELLINNIWPALIHATLYKVATNLLFRYTNSSVVADSNENSTAISLTDLNSLRKEQELSMKHHLDMLKLFLDTNSGTYPEYSDTVLDGLNAALNRPAANFFYDGPDFL